jgi:hypothetical protein
MTDDIVTDFLERMLARDPGISVVTRDALELDLRRAWGGQRVRIASRPGVQMEISLRLGLRDPRTVSRTTRWRRG